MDARSVLRFCPRCGGDALQSQDGHCFSCSDCGGSLFFNTAAAVGALIEDDAGRLLAARRARDPGAGLYDWPGGFVDHGEDLEQALRRELQEELGVVVRSLQYLCTAANSYPYQGLTYHTSDAYYLVRVHEPEGIRPADDVAAVRWCDPQALRGEDLAFPCCRIALQAYRRLRAG
ncbi:MAG: NUDIX hydrolase [Planctomycetota bacterium]